MVRGRPIVLSNGDYLLPIYDETGHHTEFTGPDTTGLFLHFNTKTDIPALRWRMSEPIRWRKGVLQPAVVEVEKDHLLAFCRPGGGFEPRNDRYVLRSESHDGGWTWTPAENTEFPNSNTAVDLLKLSNGHLLAVYHDSMTRRSPLTVAISTDGGSSFPHRTNIAEGADSYAYPYAVQTRDGKIHGLAGALHFGARQDEIDELAIDGADRPADGERVFLVYRRHVVEGAVRLDVRHLRSGIGAHRLQGADLVGDEVFEVARLHGDLPAPEAP